MEKQLKENIDFFMVTEEAWNDLQKDRFKKISPESFLKVSVRNLSALADR